MSVCLWERKWGEEIFSYGSLLPPKVFFTYVSALHLLYQFSLFFTGLVVLTITTFRNSSRELWIWRQETHLQLWSLRIKQFGCFFQLIPILIVPIDAIVVAWKTLSSSETNDTLEVSVCYSFMIVLSILISFSNSLNLNFSS